MLHGKPKTRAEAVVQHLEVNYGLQLDPNRHRKLVEELEDFGLKEREEGREFAIEQMGESGPVAIEVKDAEGQ